MAGLVPRLLLLSAHWWVDLAIGLLVGRDVSRGSYGLFGASQVALVVKNPLANAGDVRGTSLIPDLGRSLGGRHGNPLQYSCLEKPMDRGAWWAIVHRIAESDMTEAT